MTPLRLRRYRREIEHALLFLVFDLRAADYLEERDIADVVRRLPEKDPARAELLLEIRYALGIRDSLAEVLGDDSLSDRVIRELLVALEVELVARLTGERRRLPFEDGGFRAPPAPLRSSE